MGSRHSYPSATRRKREVEKGNCDKGTITEIEQHIKKKGGAVLSEKHIH